MQKAPIEKKYAGHPDSPNFLPPSPLIDRQVLSLQAERELKRVCATVLAFGQSADDDLALVARYISSKPQQDTKPHKHDKHSSFVFHPPKHYVPELAASSFLEASSSLSSKVQTQQKRDLQEPVSGVVFEPFEPAGTKVSRQKSDCREPEDEALHGIRSKLDSRPKTSAAACIDYTDPISLSCSRPTTSVPSHRTTYSTPFTSAGITPGQTSKRFSESVPNAKVTLEVEPIQTTALPEIPDDATSLPSEQAAQARAWMAEQLARRRRSPTHAPPDASANKSLQEIHPMPPRLTTGNSRPVTRADSIRNSISNGIREYIRPGSSSGSIRSNRSMTSSPSRTRQRLSVLKAKISNSSLRSVGSSGRRSGYDDGDEYFIDPKQVKLDRPLPPLPGLDSYKEKPRHIGLMMKSLVSQSAAKRGTKNVVIDPDGIERIMTTDEGKRRQDDLAKAVMEKMSMGSIGSVPASPTGVITVYRRNVEAGMDSELPSPVTAGSGMGVGALPLHETYHGRPMLRHSGSPRLMGGFVKKWRGRLGWSRKHKTAAVP